MKNKKNLKLENNEQFQKGFVLGIQFADKLEKENPKLAEKTKELLKKFMKGEKNVNI